MLEGIGCRVLLDGLVQSPRVWEALCTEAPGLAEHLAARRAQVRGLEPKEKDALLDMLPDLQPLPNDIFNLPFFQLDGERVAVPAVRFVEREALA
eukprot:8001071-Lingulodinium_polyedra.AAC.1